jgi:hypothetical protein
MRGWGVGEEGKGREGKERKGKERNGNEIGVKQLLHLQYLIRAHV